MKMSYQMTDAARPLETPQNIISRIANTKPAKSTSFRRIMAIARNTFREAVRDRVLYNLVLFVLLLTAGAVFLGELSAAQESKIIVDLGLSAMLLFGVFIAIFVGVGLVYKEIERRTVFAMFAKPVSRGEFLIGKYLGMCATLLVNVAVMGVGVSLALLYVRRGFEPLAVTIWPAIGLIFLELAIIAGISLLFSSFSSPALSALLTFFMFIIGHFSADLKAFAASMGSATTQWFFSALYYLLPNFANYSFITPAAHGRTPAPTVVIALVGYAVVYVSALLAAASIIFDRRNFK
jgi:ABC-type transport system involved in multi-copper enzyme maturation permease subunit